MSDPTPPSEPATVDYPEVIAAPPTGVPAASPHLLADVPMTVSVELGRVSLTVRELLSLRQGSVIELNRTAGSDVDVLVNGHHVARGEVVVVDEELAVRITEVHDEPNGDPRR